jgi:hypothetical protein
VVVRRGNAPRSFAYQANALLLSYGTGDIFQSYEWSQAYKDWSSVRKRLGDDRCTERLTGVSVKASRSCLYTSISTADRLESAGSIHLRSPIAANLDSICFAFIGFELWFHPEAHRAEDEVQLRDRVDSGDTVGFVAPAREQLALIAQSGLHGIPLVGG